MRAANLPALLVAAAVFAAAPAAAVKRAPYPAVAMRPLPAFAGDSALADLRRQLADAVGRQDLAAVAAFVAPDFRWTLAGAPAHEFDAARDALHNFKVAFGFRAPGRDADGPTDIGPQWDLLAFFASDPVLTQEPGAPLVCGTATAVLADPAAFDDALGRVDEPDDPSEWVYAAGETALTAKPGGGQRVAKVARAALPIVGVHPEPRSGEPAAPFTHFELLLPTGRSGWAPAARLRPLFADRLCFGKTADGWRIAVYEQAE